MAVGTDAEATPDLGAWLRAWRHRNRLTQLELAEALGYDVTYIAKIESGARRVSRQFLARLAQFAGEPEDVLLSAPLGDVARPPLPQPPDGLIGRAAAVEELARLLMGPGAGSGLRRAVRCVTLVGPPGIGKTRLAIEVAGRLDREFGAGAWWVPLLDVASPAEVGRRLQRTLAIRDDASVDPVDASIARLRRQDALLVFDNFEHVIEARTVVSRIVAETPNVTVLITSREALGLLDLELRIVDGLFIPGERDGNTTRRYGRPDGAPALEGSSIKGVLRSRSEFILRSIGVAACDPSAVKGACGKCPVCLVFGSPGRRGVVAVRSAPVVGFVDEMRSHVAIDRVSGGARDHQLFNEELLAGGTFRLVVDAIGDVPAWVRLLLLWVVRDLHDGLVGMAGRTTRGCGTVELLDPSVVADLPPLEPASVRSP